ncbi:MAG: sulfatase-like hydrolase/transferase [Akkermansiaceae bacterium]
MLQIIHALVFCALLTVGITINATAKEFLHPGISHSQENIDFIKAKIATGEEPWATAWKGVQSSRYSDLDWKPQPHAKVERGPYNNPNIGSSEFSQDAQASYTHAINWVLSGKEAHAKKAAQILNAWSGKLESISNHDARLLVGMEGYEYCNAAELLKHTWDGWPEDEQKRFAKMLRGIFYPTIKDLYPTANGNWDASMLQTILAMGVFLDDREMFDHGVNYFLKGEGNGAVRNYFKPSGQCQESGRDQGHTQMGLDFLACTAEIAWNQGVDLYSATENRLLKGFEYTAKYNLGHDVPFEYYESYKGRYKAKKISDDSRGRLRPMYEKVLNHYQNRKGLKAEFTEQAVMKMRDGSSERRSRRRSRSRSSALNTLMFAGEKADKASGKKPNIVLIFADDLGYGDLSCYGATKIKTPNIDRLASAGMKFTDAHSAASLCSPSRYGLLTGHSPWRLHKKGNGYRLSSDRPNMGSFLQKQGYTTAAIGKWHLGYSKDWNKLPITGPLEVGFDYHFGVPSNHNDSTRAFIENHDLVGRKPGEEYHIKRGQDFPDGLAKPRVEDQVDTTLTEKAVAFIRRSTNKPFFLYFTPCAPHTHVVPSSKFRGTSHAGLFGDHIQELDSHVGTILKTLDELKLSENTLVIFTSDNGSTPKDFRGTQGVHLNLADESGDIRKKFKTAKEEARKLGHVTNGPWRDGKGYPYEGGHRIPFIARWPGHIAPGSSTNALLNLTDLYGTAADILDQDLPKQAAEDSISALPVLLGEKTTRPEREAIFILGDGKDSAIAVCSGQWKLIVRYGKDRAESYELFDLQKDPGELNNLSEQHPKITARLSAGLKKAEDTGRTRP